MRNEAMSYFEKRKRKGLSQDINTLIKNAFRDAFHFNLNCF